MTSQLSHQVDDNGDMVRIALTGEIDLAVADQLHELLTSPARERPGTAVTVDMSSVRFIDSTGVRTLVRARDQVLAGGGDLRLVNLGDMALRILQVSGMYGYLCETDSR